MSIRPASIANDVDFLRRAVTVTSTKAVKDLLVGMPVVPETDYQFDEKPITPRDGRRDTSTGTRWVGSAATPGGSSSLVSPRTLLPSALSTPWRH